MKHTFIMQEKKNLFDLLVSFFFLHLNTEFFAVKRVIYGFNEKTQLTTRSSDPQSDREHTQQQVNHLFLDHLTRCTTDTCMHTQLRVHTHTPKYRHGTTKVDQKPPLSSVSLKALALCVSFSKGKSFKKDAAKLFTNFMSSVSTLHSNYFF